MPYNKRVMPRWSDFDMNRHMRNTAYSELATHVRLGALADNGFSADDLTQAGLGPVIFREETVYHREVRFGEPIDVDFAVTQLSLDGRKFTFRHQFRNGDGEVVAAVTLDGAWLDLETRRLTKPPEALSRILHTFHEDED